MRNSTFLTHISLYFVVCQTGMVDTNVEQQFLSGAIQFTAIDFRLSRYVCMFVTPLAWPTHKLSRTLVNWLHMLSSKTSVGLLMYHVTYACSLYAFDLRYDTPDYCEISGISFVPSDLK